MKLVLDSNIIFSALIKESTTRNIILSDAFDLNAPEYIFSEITKHNELLLRKSTLDKRDFDALLLLLQKHIHLVSNEKYDKKTTIAEDILRVDFWISSHCPRSLAPLHYCKSTSW